MGFWKGLVDKVTQKKEELEEEAKKRAAKKATDLVIDTGKAAARAAVKNAGKTLDYAGKKLEEAIFGESTSAGDEAPPSKNSPPAPAPDPFAKLKAEEAMKKLAAAAKSRARQDEHAKTEREVDDELAALKKKLRGP